MSYVIPPKVLEMYLQLSEAGFEVYFVGGCVRGMLMSRAVHDWDLATNATPEETQKVFPDSYYDNPFGTVGVPFEDEQGAQVLDITTYRKDGVYRDGRRPESVEWGSDIKEDLARRDFTINAMAIKISDVKNQMSKTQHEKSDWGNMDALDYELVDPFGGGEDINLGVIRAVGVPSQRFHEDALRMMRAVRIATQLNFEIEKHTLDAIIHLRANIAHVAWERISLELFKILSSEYPGRGIRLLDKVGLLEYILPELTAGRDISMVRPGRHHTTDVFEHNVRSLEFTPSIDPVVRLATLIHDVGKPATVSTDQDGLVIFYNHEVVGAKMAKIIADRLRLSKHDRERLYLLVRWHMFSVDDALSEKAIRRFIRRVGVENIRDIIDLRIGDRLGSGATVAESWRLKNFRERISQELNPPFSLTDMKIDGNRIMEMFSISPGPEIGVILKKLFSEVDEDLSLNTTEYLEQRAREIYEENKKDSN